MAADPVYIVAAPALTLNDITNRLVVTGAVGTVEDSSIIQESDSGLVVVVERWPRRRRRWTLTWGPDNYAALENLYIVNGRKYPFLFIPPRTEDYTVPAPGHWFASGDGVTDTFQLTRGYLTFDADDNGVRVVVFDMHYPIDDAFFEVSVNGTPDVGATLAPGGLVTFSSTPPTAAILRVTCHFATPVRWASETIDVTLQDSDLHELRSATIVEDFES